MPEKLLTVQEAQARIIALIQPVGVESVPLAASGGRVLAQTVTAPADLPSFANSSMDGFAVRAVDVQSARPDTPVRLPVVADIAAGAALPAALQAGQAARIMTGAPLPEGADAVVPVEETNFAPGLDLPASLEEALIFQPAARGANVRPRGQDVRQGQVLLQPGRRLVPSDVGMLAAAGLAEVAVYRRPRVAVFSSGSELVQPGEPLGQGQIYDANQYSLSALVDQAGAQVVRLGAAPDDPLRIQAALETAVEGGVDLIISSAGVSVGAYDYIRGVIETQGRLDFWKVNMRPGKPLAYGIFHGIPLIGLPGNPVSALVGGYVFVLPALRRLSGQIATAQRRVTAVLGEPVESDGRESYLRAVVSPEDGRLVARLTGHQGSGNLYSLVQANALLIVPSGVKSLPAESPVEIWYFAPE